MRYYSKTTGCTYLESVHGQQMPADAVPIPDGIYLAVIANPAPGKIRSHDANGLPILIDPPPCIPSSLELCQAIDKAADTARAKVAGDPLRAVEYDRAATEAQAFKAAGYPGDAVPRTVAAWAIGGRTAQQAADSILVESAAYTEALYQIREARLGAKEMVRQAMADGDVDQAQDIAAETIAAIESAISGIGNARV